ncbi:hypothetical protein VNO77_46807 [Canavalia gladiata]|uniref:Uncharacterized protein n=1 Tax=Canavalia gladiata TaxID=3824 RepID=A0AAN9JH95_CANGL
MAERLTLPPLLAQSVRQGCGFAVTRSSLLPQMAPTSFGPACSHPIKRDTRNQDRYKILDGLRGPQLIPINEDDASRQYATDDYHCRSKSELKNEFNTFLAEATEASRV